MVINDTSINLSIELIASYYQLYAETKTMVKSEYVKTTKNGLQFYSDGRKNNFVLRFWNYYSWTLPTN
jgi:hypothetical protein